MSRASSVAAESLCATDSGYAEDSNVDGASESELDRTEHDAGPIWLEDNNCEEISGKSESRGSISIASINTPIASMSASPDWTKKSTRRLLISQSIEGGISDPVYIPDFPPNQKPETRCGGREDFDPSQPEAANASQDHDLLTKAQQDAPLRHPFQSRDDCGSASTLPSLDEDAYSSSPPETSDKQNPLDDQRSLAVLLTRPTTILSYWKLQDELTLYTVGNSAPKDPSDTPDASTNNDSNGNRSKPQKDDSIGSFACTPSHSGRPMHRKRRRLDDDDGHSDNEPHSDEDPDIRSDESRRRSSLKQKFACPFFKSDPIAYGACHGINNEIDSLYRHHVKDFHTRSGHLQTENASSSEGSSRRSQA